MENFTPARGLLQTLVEGKHLRGHLKKTTHYWMEEVLGFWTCRLYCLNEAVNYGEKF